MYIQIMPAADWFFIHDNARPGRPPIVWRLAAWGLTGQGEVVGLVGAFGREVEPGVTPKLVSIPPLPGDYRHVSELTEIERKAAAVPVPTDAAAAAYLIHINGNVGNLSNGGAGFTQAAQMTVGGGDWEGLRTQLLALGLKDGDLTGLQADLDEAKARGTGLAGKPQTWVGKLAGKAIAGAAGLGVEALAGGVAKAIGAYLGGA